MITASGYEIEVDMSTDTAHVLLEWATDDLEIREAVRRRGAFFGWRLRRRIRRIQRQAAVLLRATRRDQDG